MATGEWDVAVLGAGLAGLTAARQLAAAGRRVVVFEASDRVGGRVHSLHEPGWPAPIEAGAEFVHGESPALRRLLREAGIETDAVAARHYRAASGRVERVDFDAAWDPVVERLNRLAGDADPPFDRFLREQCADLPPADRELAMGYVEGFNAADARRLSTRWLKESEAAAGEEGGPPRRPRGGYGPLLDWLRNQLDPGRVETRLNTAVRTVRWHPGRVWVATAAAGEVVATAAVVTLPLDVLRRPPDVPGGLTFDPELPARRAAWAGLAMGSVVKLVVRFQEPFWEAQAPGLGFLHTPGGPLQAWWAAGRAAPTVLTGWAGGPAAEALAGLRPEEVRDRGLAQLAAALGTRPGGVAARVEDWQVFDWQVDSSAGGAYSYVPAGRLGDVRRSAEPEAGTLFFAGEATDERWAGTTAGAVASGERAAAEVLAALGSTHPAAPS
jgi:monoamine oxidase